MTASAALADMLIEAQTELEKERESRIELEIRIDSLTAELSSLSRLLREQKPVASAGKKSFNVTIVERDGEQNAKMFRVER
jgi:hypothetical protein